MESGEEHGVERSVTGLLCFFFLPLMYLRLLPVRTCSFVRKLRRIEKGKEWIR